MILATSRTKPLAIGRRYAGIWVGLNHHPNQPFIVLRESTLGEWCYAPAVAYHEEGEQILPSEALFYEVSLDYSNLKHSTTGAPAALVACVRFDSRNPFRPVVPYPDLVL